jgi:hypothetical protein
MPVTETTQEEPSPTPDPETDTKTEEPDVLISDVEDLQEMNRYLSLHYALEEDIDATDTENWNDGKGFEPIGGDSPFTGSLDGRGHEIRGLSINRTEVEGNRDGRDVGLIRSTGEGATIKNIGLTDVSITGGDSVGSLVGDNHGEILDVYTSGTVVQETSGERESTDQTPPGNARYKSIGGLVGSSSGLVKSSHSTTTVEGGTEVGGLIGTGGDIESSYFDGEVSGDQAVGGLIGSGGNVDRSKSSGTIEGGYQVGGLVGNNGGEITNSYSEATVRGNDQVGGLIGSSDEEANKCYSVGKVTGESNAGGLIGSGRGGRYSFWDVDSSGQTRSAGSAEGKPTSIMQSIDNYPEDYWSIALKEEYQDQLWYIDDGEDYPRLGWEHPDL